MSLVEKIPPLISALAFGYGVGMAAPDVSFDKKTEEAQRPKPRVTRMAESHVAPGLSASLESKLPGEEASGLRELRAA